jgi:hypothetical protein
MTRIKDNKMENKAWKIILDVEFGLASLNQ